jgi:hypothetical protein
MIATMLAYSAPLKHQIHYNAAIDATLEWKLSTAARCKQPYIIATFLRRSYLAKPRLLDIGLHGIDRRTVFRQFDGHLTIPRADLKHDAGRFNWE